MENTALQSIKPNSNLGLSEATREISTGLFNEFVEWIDRNEKTTRTYLTNLRQGLFNGRASGHKIRPGIPGRMGIQDGQDRAAHKDKLQAEHYCAVSAERLPVFQMDGSK